MCFSAEASLSSAVLLGVIGSATLREIKQPKWQLLALLPFIFGFQQFFEGISWLTFDGVLSERWLPLGKWGFIFFAYLFWPIWMPVALLRSEESPPRKKLMASCLVAGLIFTIGMVAWLLKPETDLVASVNGHSIQYLGVPPLENSYFYPLQVLYLYATILPCLLSSSTRAVIFGLLLLAGWMITQYFYFETATSVWCFFSAITSAALYFLLRGKKNV